MKNTITPQIRPCTWRRFALAGFAAALLGLAHPLAPVHAAPALDQEVPTLIDSDRLEYDDARQISVFSGNVVLTRGQLTLHSARLELRQEPNGDQFAVATAEGGRQVFVRQTNPDHVEVIEGYADRAEYASNSNILEFIGHAVVSRMACGQTIDQVRGERIRYNQESEVYTATGGARSGGPNQRVRTVIGPRQQSQETVRSCPPGTGAQ